jgi:predicted ABC-class ATPase
MKKLHHKINLIDGHNYGKYRTLHGKYNLAGMDMEFLHIQSDPYAPASRISVSATPQTLGIPKSFVQSRKHCIALADYLLRSLSSILLTQSEPVGTGNSGSFSILTPGQEILEQTALQISPQKITVHIGLGLPADGRRILASHAQALLIQALPDALTEALFWINVNEEAAQKHIDCYLWQEQIREQLEALHLVAFIGDGAILPRASGASQAPLPNAIPFASPQSLQVTITTDWGVFTGLGIPTGVTLIAGGGFHGKSTLLKALERGVYNHIPGDGRELVVCNQDACKIRAEDGRVVQGTDISTVIQTLPGGVSTRAFCTQNASGSTSQAANLLESLEMGSKTILIDEDVSAVNFLIRDYRMRALVELAHEPVIPLIDRLSYFKKKYECSFVMVIGACGDYLDYADTVLVLRDYNVIDATHKAQSLVKEMPRHNTAQELNDPKSSKGIAQNANWPVLRREYMHCGQRSGKVKSHPTRIIHVGAMQINAAFLEQITGHDQINGVGAAIAEVMRRELWQNGDFVAILQKLASESLDQWKLNGSFDIARPRVFEIGAALLRLQFSE